jgi:hypothetical protein
MNTSFNVNKVANGWTLRVATELDNGDYQNDVFIASTAAKLKKMINNAINLVEKETVNAD